METIKDLKEKIINHTLTYIEENGIDKANVCELGEAIDMIKDLSEAIYYCTVVKAMEENPTEETIAHLKSTTTP